MFGFKLRANEMEVRVASLFFAFGFLSYFRAIYGRVALAALDARCGRKEEEEEDQQVMASGGKG